MKRNTWSFGLGTIGRDMVYTLVSMFLMVYLTDVLDVSDADLTMIGIVFMLMRIFDAVNDPVMGLLVDNTKSRFGKFKPWIAGGALLAGFFTVLMFVDFGVRGSAYVLIFAIVYLLWEVSFTANDIAYWSMLPALSSSQRDREKIGAFARICANIGLFSLVVGIVPLTKYLETVFGDMKTAYTALAILLVLIMWFFQLFTLIFTKEENELIEEQEPTKLSELFGVILKNDQLLWTTVSMALFMIGYTTTTSFGLHFFKYIFGNEDMYSIFALVLGVSQIGALIVFPQFSKRFKRNQLYFGATILVVLGYLIFYFFDQSIITIGLAGVLLFVGQAFIQLLMLLFISDTVEYGEVKLGKRNDSITLSIQPLINKIGGAIAAGIVSQVLVISGVNSATSAADITPEGATFFKLAMLIIPLILIVIGYFVYRAKYTINEESYLELLEEISRRQHETN
ncbi:MAG TPA: MFS transporter [Erysipelothrix sp.]|nr:MFS transporter [Erysipelothrix sp.]